MPPDLQDIILKRLDRIDITLDGIQRDVRAFSPIMCADHERRLRKSEAATVEIAATRAAERILSNATWTKVGVAMAAAGAVGGGVAFAVKAVLGTIGVIIP